jgi:hypothetical protein
MNHTDPSVHYLYGRPSVQIDGLDPRVVAEIEAFSSHRIALCRAEAYVGDTDQHVALVFDPPVEFRLSQIRTAASLTPTDAAFRGLQNVCDDWLDPYMDVEPIDPSDPQVSRYRSFYCYGTSYHLRNGSIQPGDVVEVRAPLSVEPDRS